MPEYIYTETIPELSEKQLAERESSRQNVAKLPKYEIKFFGKFKDGMKWNSTELLDPKKGIFHVVSGTKMSVHLVPVGGNLWDKFSVPKNKMKIIRRVKE